VASGLGVSETPEIRALPWDKPSRKELRREAVMGKLGTWGTVLGVIGGAVGLYASLRALGWIGRKK
jgi:hypothetical protein